MKLIFKTVFTTIICLLLLSCQREPRENFNAKLTAQSCVDFRILLSQFSKNMLVPLEVNLKSKETWGEFCACVGSIFEQEFETYKDTKLEALLKFENERTTIIKSILQKNQDKIIVCYEKQDYQEKRLIKKYLESLK